MSQKKKQILVRSGVLIDVSLTFLVFCNSIHTHLKEFIHIKMSFLYTLMAVLIKS